MIIWINGAFGAGKTSVSELLVQRIPDAHLFDPEDLGYIIQKTFPVARTMDYQDLPLWRSLVAQFIVESRERFPVPLIIPMTLVLPDYINEIFSAIAAQHIPLHHFFLHTEKAELQRRIKNQVIIESDPAKDEEVRQWRIAQIDRCHAASSLMPSGTLLLNTNANSPLQLAEQIVEAVA